MQGVPATVIEGQWGPVTPTEAARDVARTSLHGDVAHSWWLGGVAAAESGRNQLRHLSLATGEQIGGGGRGTNALLWARAAAALRAVGLSCGFRWTPSPCHQRPEMLQ